MNYSWWTECGGVGWGEAHFSSLLLAPEAYTLLFTVLLLTIIIPSELHTHLSEPGRVILVPSHPTTTNNKPE